MSDSAIQNTSSNSTKPSYPFELLNNTTLPIFVIFAVIVWLVNITLLVTIFVDPLHCLKRMSGRFVAGISLSSIIMATAVILFTLQVKDSLYSLAVIAVMMTSNASITFFILILSTERFALTTEPMRYKVFMTDTRAKMITILTFVLSVCFAIAMFWLWRKQSHIYKYCYTVHIVLVSFIIFTNGLTFYKLKTSNRALNRMPNSVIQQARNSRFRIEKRFAQVVFLLLVNFILFACPVFVVDALVRHNTSCNGCLFSSEVRIDRLYFVTMLLVQFHAINNALFYLVLIPKYRQSLKAIWKAASSYFNAN